MPKDELIKIKPFVYDDQVINHRIRMRKSKFYSILSIDGRDFFFNKDTGEFDGTGIAPCEKTEE